MNRGRTATASRRTRRPYPIRSLIIAAAACAALLSAPGSAPAATTYTNATPLTIPQSGPASSYPSFLDVSGLRGPIANLTLTLHGVGHSYPRDLDILLAAPDGKTVVVMSDVCGDGDVEDVTWSFPENGSWPLMGESCPSGAYEASDRNLGFPDTWPGAPPPPHGSLAGLLGLVDGNGVWRLFVVDDTVPDGGDIEGGWSLTFETAPVKAFLPGVGTSGPADPYPLTQTVRDRPGVIADAQVSVTGLGHRRPDDLDVLLVGPNGQKVMLMSDACGEPDVSVRWTWSDDAADAMPDGTDIEGCPPRAVYRPTDHEPGESLPAPAPAGPYDTALSAFDGTDPNGEWRVYVDDDSVGEQGYLVEDLRLLLETRPEAAVAFAEPALEVAEGATGALTLTRSAPSALGAASVKVTGAPGTAASGGDFEPLSTTVRFGPGETRKTVPVRALGDALAEESEVFTVTIDDVTGDARRGTPASAAVIIREVPAAVDRTPPAIGAVTLDPARFAARARGTTIGYTLSEPAAVRLRFQRAAAGRRAGRACRRPTARRGRRCVRYVPAGTLRRTGHAGLNRVAFGGRIGRRTLRAGRYRLVVTATDAAGNRATAPPLGFRIVG